MNLIAMTFITMTVFAYTVIVIYRLASGIDFIVAIKIWKEDIRSYNSPWHDGYNMALYHMKNPHTFIKFDDVFKFLLSEYDFKQLEKYGLSSRAEFQSLFKIYMKLETEYHFRILNEVEMNSIFKFEEIYYGALTHFKNQK